MDDNSSREQLEFLLVSDSNYASYLATAMASILENAPDDERLRFHIVDAGLTPRDAARIESLKSIRPFELTFYRPDLSEYLKLFPKHIGWLPVVCNCRLFLAKYLPKTLDKVLYLDVDLVVLGDLRELWNKRVDDVYFAAAPDRYVTEEHKKTLGLPESRAYFNSGVLLVNVKKWRDEGLAEQAIDVCGEIYDKIRYQDQDVLNVIASRSDYLELDEKCLRGRRNARSPFYGRASQIAATRNPF